MDDYTPAWVYELPNHSRITLADSAKDEFFHHLRTFMREEYDYGHSSQTLVSPELGRIEEYKLNTPDGTELPRFWVRNQEDALHLFLAAEEDPTEEELETWEQGIAAALGQMGSRRSVGWIAIIGQKQSSPFDLPGQQLSAPITVDNLTFGLLAGGFTEDAAVTSPGSGVMIGQFTHWPIKLTGSTSCYSWEGDGEWLTLMRLRMVTALLSLAWDSCWSLREGPRDPKVSFAGDRGPLMGRSWESMPEGSPFANGRLIEVPAWVVDAEVDLSKKPRLAHALLTHQEGLALRRDHSSMALVAFVSAIEATTQITKKPERCEECNSILSSRKRFDDAIQSVLSGEMAELLSNAYPKRSRTAHEGRLHGTELRSNSWGLMSTFVPDDQFTFTEGTVRAAQEASRRLLLKHLGLDFRRGRSHEDATYVPPA